MQLIIKLPLLLLSAVPILNTSRLIDNDQVTFIVNGKGVLSALTSEQDYNYYLTLSNADGSVSVKTVTYNATTNAKLTSTSVTLSTLSNVNRYITLPFKNRLKSDGLRVELTLASLKQSMKSITISGTVFPYLKSIINTQYSREEPVELIGTFFLLKDNEIYTDEKFSFVDTVEYLSTGNRNNINFKEVKFLYYEFPFQCESIEYHIKDYGNVYPNLEKTDNEIVLSMSFEQNNNEISLLLNEELYVNQDTLEMSSIPLADYVPTNELFIPVGCEESFGLNESYIVIKNAGYSLSDITMPFSFYYSKKYIGQCYDSDYCISGGVKE